MLPFEERCVKKKYIERKLQEEEAKQLIMRYDPEKDTYVEREETDHRP